MEDYNIDKCAFCGEKSFYVLEWYGLNQYEKKPLVVQNFGSCTNFDHIVKIVKSNFLNAFEDIDGIVDYKTLQKEHKRLAEIVNLAYHIDDDFIYLLGQELIYRDLSKNQKLLFSYEQLHDL